MVLTQRGTRVLLFKPPNWTKKKEEERIKMRSPSFVLLPSCFFFLNTTRSAQGQNTKENGVNSSRRDQARFSSSFLLAAKAKTSSSSAF